MRTRRDFALASLLLPVHVCLAQSLIGQELGFEFRGNSIGNQSGTLVVSAAGPEVVLTEMGRTYTIDVDATGVSLTVDFEPQVAFNTSFGTNSPFSELVRQLRLTGLRFDNGDSIVGLQISGDTDALPEDVFLDGDTLVIGSEERGELFTFLSGETVRADLEPDPCPGPTIVNTRTGEIFETIQAAIDGSANGDTLQLAACTFSERDIVLTGRTIELRGAGIGQTVIDGQGIAGTLLTIGDNADIALAGMTLQNGLADGTLAGAIRAFGSARVLIDGCEIADNDSGGTTSGAVVVHNGNGDLTVRNTIFRDNANDVSSLGPAIHAYVSRGTASFINCVFAGGTGGSAQIAIREDADVDVANCTFAGYGDGNSISILTGGTARFRNLATDGLATQLIRAQAGPGPFTVARSIFPGATGDNIDGAVTFADPDSGDYRLAPGSLGIDYADADAYVAAGGGLLDLDGAARTGDDRGITDTGTGVVAILDVGAFEFRGRTLLLMDTDVNNDGVVDFFDVLEQIRLGEAAL
ncbi:MAG: right-handed parallel beta-helix repeat-containing protein [Planctomycetota bacterium]